MKIPKLDNANGYAELVPQTIWHQLAARLLAALLGWAVLEQAKATSKIGQDLLTHALGPADKLWKFSLPAERRRARDGLARLEAEVAVPGIDYPLPDPRTVADAEANRHLFRCNERFQGDFDVWRACELPLDHDGDHSDVPPPCGERFLGQDLDWHVCTIPGQHQKSTRHHMREQVESDGATVRLVYETIDHLDDLAAEAEPETTEA